MVEKQSWSIPYVFVAFFLSLKHNFIVYRSSKVSDFELHQLWQSGFSRVYSNSCSSCSFEPEIMKIGQSSHKMYGNNILNFQESMTILNAHTKKVRKHIVFICLFVCLFTIYLSCVSLHKVTIFCFYGTHSFLVLAYLFYTARKIYSVFHFRWPLCNYVYLCSSALTSVMYIYHLNSLR